MDQIWYYFTVGHNDHTRSITRAKEFFLCCFVLNLVKHLSCFMKPSFSKNTALPWLFLFSKSTIKISKQKYNWWNWLLTLINIVLFWLWHVALDTNHKHAWRCDFVSKFHVNFIVVWLFDGSLFQLATKAVIFTTNWFHWNSYFCSHVIFSRLASELGGGSWRENELLTRSSLYFSKQSLGLVVFIMAKHFHFYKSLHNIYVACLKYVIYCLSTIWTRWCLVHDSSGLVHLVPVCEYHC